MTARQCHECGITEIAPEVIEIDGDILCWVNDDLCSICQTRLQHELEQDAARYRHLRGKQVRTVDIEAGGVFAGRQTDECSPARISTGPSTTKWASTCRS